MKFKPTLVGLALGAWTSACCTTPKDAAATTPAPASATAAPEGAPAGPAKPAASPVKDAKDTKEQPAKKDGAMTKDAADKVTAEVKAPDAKVALHASHDHKHGDKCGHEAVKHGNHVDYKHDGHKHQVVGNDAKECQ